jgi:hypothetical protein
VNGAEVFRLTDIGFSTLQLNNDPLSIGRTLSSKKFFHGKIDDILIHNRTLTASEIQAYYNSSKPATTGCNGDTQLPDDLCNGLTLYMPMNGNANDASGNGRNGTEHGQVDYVAGVSGQAVQFNGNLENYITVAHEETLNFKDSFTISFWLYQLAETKVRFDEAEQKWYEWVVLGKGRACLNSFLVSGNGRIFRVKNDDNCSDSSSQHGIYGTGVPIKEWHLVTAIFDKQEEKIKYYLDGVLKGENNAVGYQVTNEYPLVIGKQFSKADGSISHHSSKAIIDELFIYNRALSDAEIQQLANPTRPVAHYCFDDPDNLANDCSGNGAHGILAYTDGEYDVGTSGNAIRLDGVDDFVNISAVDSDFMRSAFTILTWFKPAEVKEKQAVIWFQDGQPSIGMKESGIYYGFRSSSSVPPDLSKARYVGSHVVHTDDWNCAVYTYDASDEHTLRHFLNGFQIFYGNLSENFIPSATGKARIGRDDSINRSFNGLIDEVEIYNYVLSEEEIQTRCPQKPIPEKLVAHYCFDDPDNLGKNCAANGHHGTVQNGATSTEGVSGNAIALDGQDDFVAISNFLPYFMGNSFTIAAWFKPNKLKVRNEIFWFQDDQPSMNLSNDKVHFKYKYGDETVHKIIGDGLTDNQILPIGEWNCAVYSYDGYNNRTAKYFLNGNQIGERTLEDYFVPTQTGVVKIGSDDAGGERTFNGAIDDVRLYNYALSDEDIQSLCPTPPSAAVMMLEDAEDGDTQGLKIVENYSASFSIVFDEEKDSQVLEFQGESHSRYELKQPDGSNFDETDKFIAQWSTKGRVGIVSWAIGTDVGVQHIDYSFYKRLGCYRSTTDAAYVNCGIDMSALDGSWHTFTRDLEADLKSAIPDATLEDVNYFVFRAGNGGRIDDIKLINSDSINKVTIAGQVMHDGQAVSGVIFGNSGPDCQASDNNGDFTCTVPEGWFGTLVPEKDGYLFESFTRVYRELSKDMTAQNFTAKPIPTDDTQPILHWTRDMHPVEGNGAVHLPYLWENYVDDHFTITAQIKPTVMKSRNYVFHANDDYPGIWLEGKDGKMKVLFVYRPNGTAKPIPTSVNTFLRSEPIPLNEWTEVTATWDGSEYAGYVNGQIVGKVALPKFVKGTRVAIGWDGGTDRYFEGEIAEVKIYKRALTFKTDCNAVTEIPTAQCETLLALYDNTGGDNWTNNDGWKKGNTPCSWYGIACADGKVVTIELNTNNLDGTIPDLSALTSLRRFQLAENKLTGSLPPFSIFTNLESVWLSTNQLTGSVPELTGLTKLVSFHIWNNQLTGTIPELSSLTQLQNFDLGKNQLTGNIPELKTLTQIQRLNLAANKLEGPIPDLLATWPELYISDNPLCQNPEANYAGRTEVEAFPICGEQPPEPVIAEPIVEGNSVTLDASGSSDPDPEGKITNHRWVTSDGQIATGANPTITFPADGEYTITLIVTDNTGKTIELEQVVTIGEPTIPKAEKTGPFKLTVSKRGTGKGSIQSTVPDTNIVCDTDCNRASSEYAKDTEVTIMATPASGSTFTNWTSCGNGTDSTTTVTMSRRRYCTANFELDQTQTVLHRVRVVKIGDGNGLITVKQDGVIITRCSTATCEPKFFAPGTELTFIAKGRNGATFVSWGEDCSGTDSKLPITINAATKCTAEFTLPPPLPTQHRLTVTTIMETTAQGYVTGSGIECGDDCVENILAGKKARLKANPMPHSHFKEWANDCSGTRASTSVIMDSAKTCTAIFGSDSDRNAEDLVEEFNDEAELIGGDEKFTDVYPPIDNTDCLLEAYRLTENVMIKVEEHLFLTGSWPHQFHGQEWYKPMPADICTKSIKIISGGTDVKLAEGPVFVEGDYIKVEVELLTDVGIKEILPILIYYGDKPEAEDANRRRRRARRYCCWRPRRRRW